jgi:hypothetical protein
MPYKDTRNPPQIKCNEFILIGTLNTDWTLISGDNQCFISDGSLSVTTCAVQCSAVQCSAVQCGSVQCSAVQCLYGWNPGGYTVQCSAVQCSAVSDWTLSERVGHKEPVRPAPFTLSESLKRSLLTWENPRTSNAQYLWKQTCHSKSKNIPLCVNSKINRSPLLHWNNQFIVYQKGWSPALNAVDCRNKLTTTPWV